MSNKGRKFNQGAFLVSRSIFESDIWFKPPEYLKIWLYLFGKANHKGRRFRGNYCERGQYFCDYKELLEQLDYKVGFRKKRFNENSMKTLMKYLRDTLMIHTMKQPRGILITICKYDEFQDLKNYEATNEATNEATSPKPAQNQKALSINKNVKELKNEKKEPKPLCAKNKIPEGFEEFYQAYPKKKNKPDALEAWKQVFLKPAYLKYHGPVPLKKILDSIESHRNSHEWSKKGGQYIPGPGVWLRAHGFNDPVKVDMDTEEEHDPFKGDNLK